LGTRQTDFELRRGGENMPLEAKGRVENESRGISDEE